MLSLSNSHSMLNTALPFSIEKKQCNYDHDRKDSATKDKDKEQGKRESLVEPTSIFASLSKVPAVLNKHASKSTLVNKVL